MTKKINVLLHGVFGYIFREDFIEVFTPSVCGHLYTAGGLDQADTQPLERGEIYRLEGVWGDPTQRAMPDPLHHPVLPLKGNPVIDEFGKAYCILHLPYPAKIEGYNKQLFAVDAYQVGSIFAGKDSTPLNQLEECPSLLVFVYASNEDELLLTGEKSNSQLNFDNLPISQSSNTQNFHIWCTTNPLDMDMHGRTPDGHLRRAFAALVDLFPTMEITIQIPDGFTPASCEDNPPEGVDLCDIDPGREECGHFGKVNCHYANLLLWPS